MLGIDGRAMRAAWSVFLVALLLVIVYFTRRVLLVFILAVLFAYLLSPMVNLVERVIRRPRSRTWALAAVYVLLVGVLIGAGIILGNKVTQQATNLSQSFPHLVDNFRKELAKPGPPWLQPVKNYVLEQVNERGGNLGRMVLPAVEEISKHVVEVLSSAVLVVLIPILSFFFLKDGRELKEQVLSLAGTRRPMWEDIAEDLHLLLGQFIRALVILAVITLVVFSVVLALLGVPYSVLLGAVAALLEFIPVVGPLAAAVLVALVAGFSGASVVAVLVFLAVYRLNQDYVVSPHLMSSGVELHPLLVIFGVLAGEELAGIPGMFLSVPVLATLRVVYVRIRKAPLLARPAKLTEVEPGEIQE